MASGDTLVVFTALQNEPPAANFATLDTRNSIPVLDFDDTTAETAEFSGVMPRHYAGTTGITVTLGWMATDTTVTPHVVDWDVAFKSVSDDADDLDSKAYAAVNSNDDEQEASASGEVKYSTITFTDGADMDSVAAGEYFRMKVTRDATNDTLTDDAELVFAEIRET